MASLAAPPPTHPTTLNTVDVTRQKWEVVAFTGGQQHQTHYVEYCITIRVTAYQPVEKVVCVFQRRRRFTDFDNFSIILTN